MLRETFHYIFVFSPEILLIHIIHTLLDLKLYDYHPALVSQYTQCVYTYCNESVGKNRVLQDRSDGKLDFCNDKLSLYILLLQAVDIANIMCEAPLYKLFWVLLSLTELANLSDNLPILNCLEEY